MFQVSIRLCNLSHRSFLKIADVLAGNTAIGARALLSGCLLVSDSGKVAKVMEAFKIRRIK
jgi:hypothetical protein